ncbi:MULTISPECIES: hypothetical protein [Brachybacterium]|uniref:Uncharacterized protein n=1 Tax=Brachybacterium kimchii TaxID=2942909 RepID=A0ABY4N7D6_9MICO|nr:MULTISPECIES: hypothetical protein [Brachybacterium]MCG7308285.1 hypothetical protein [Brachybacterium sp. ACRRE]UQN30464.1 hypothetical protein M4486_03740 [Brachybacterium kimchii]
MTDQMLATDDITDDAPTEAVDTAPDVVEDPAPRAKRTPKARSRSGRTPKPSVRRIAEKAEEIAETDDQTRELVAQMIGAPSVGIADLTTSIMEAKRTPLERAVADLNVIQDGSIPEAVVHLVGMSKPELQSLAQVVTAFADVEIPDKIPTKSTDAALVLVDPVREAQVDQAAIERLIGLLAK